MPYSLNNDDIRGGACDVWADLSFMKPSDASPRSHSGPSKVTRASPPVREWCGRPGRHMARGDAAALQQLIDKDEIVDLVHSYSYCVDHRLYDEVVQLFTEDCVVDYGPGVPPVRSRAGLRQMFGHPDAGFAATSHHNANVLVTFEDRSMRRCAHRVRLAPAGRREHAPPLGLLPRRGRPPSRGMAHRGATASDPRGRGLDHGDAFGSRWRSRVAFQALIHLAALAGRHKVIGTTFTV